MGYISILERYIGNPIYLGILGFQYIGFPIYPKKRTRVPDPGPGPWNRKVPAKTKKVPAKNKKVPAKNKKVPVKNRKVPAKNGKVPSQK